MAAANKQLLTAKSTQAIQHIAKGFRPMCGKNIAPVMIFSYRSDNKGHHFR